MRKAENNVIQCWWSDHLGHCQSNSQQLPIFHLETFIWRMPCFAVIRPRVGFHSVMPAQHTGLSQPVLLSGSAVYNNNETAANPIWHILWQSQETPFSRTEKALKQVPLFGESCSSFAEAWMFYQEGGIHKTHRFMKEAKIPFQNQPFSEKKKLMILTVTFFPLFFTFFFPSRVHSALHRWNGARCHRRDKQGDI